MTQEPQTPDLTITRIDVGAAIENVSIVFSEGNAKSVINSGSFYGSFVNVVASGQGSFKGNNAFIFSTRTDIYSSDLKSFDAAGLKGRADVDFISDKGVTVTGSSFADDFDFFSPGGGLRRMETTGSFSTAPINLFRLLKIITAIFSKVAPVTRLMSQHLLFQQARQP
jgi:hypothetical protein